MDYIRKRENKNGVVSFRVQIRKKGFPRVNRSFKTEEEARAFSLDFQKSFSKVYESPLEIPRLPLGIWIERYKEDILPKKSYKTRNYQFFEFWQNSLGKDVAIDISPLKIELMADNLCKERGLSKESRRKYLLFLSSLYNTAIKDWKWAKSNPLWNVNMKQPTEKEVYEKRKPIECPGIEGFKKDFCLRVEQLRKEKNLSQAQAAKLCGMSKTTYQHCVGERANPSIDKILKISNAFGIKVIFS